MIKKNFLVFGSMAVMGLAFMSCSKDLYSEDAVNELQDATYAANFEKRYGKIDPNQTWDFTTGETTYSTGSSGSSTRAVASVADADFHRVEKVMTIQPAISAWVFENLPKGKDNSGKGRPFVMGVGKNDFTIVPLFQGCASYYWELWMHVDDLANGGKAGDMLIWSKGEGLEFRKSGSTGAFAKVGTGTDGMKKENGPFEVKAPSYTYDKLPEGSAMSFYLKVWKSYSDFQNYEKNPLDVNLQPEVTSSLTSMMLDVNCPIVPTDVTADYTATIIGCEDNSATNSDKDYEDLIFMVYGKPVPPTQRVETVVVEKTKRYIMEDLGDTDDFDFNDVVFDISYDRQEITYFYDGDDVHPSRTTTTALPNIGIVRATGGIYDFDIKIGNTVKWTKSSVASGIINTYAPYNPNYVIDTFDATGFNANSNNISVDVKFEDSSAATKKMYTIPFPEKGTAPKIVAVPAGTYWMTERTKVPTTWFTSSSN